MREIVIFNTANKEVDLAELETKFSSIGCEPFYSDFGMCPWLVAFVDDDSNLDVHNINDGFIKNLRLQQDIVRIIEVESAAEFIEQAYIISKSVVKKQPQQQQSNALF